MAKKYSEVATQALKVQSEGIQARVTPGDKVTGNVTLLRDSFTLANVEVADVLYIGVPLPKGAQIIPHLCRIDSFRGAVFTAKMGYEPLNSADGTGDDDIFGAAVAARDATATTTAKPDSIPALGVPYKLESQSWIILTVASKTAASGSSAIPSTADAGKIYIELAFTQLN